MSKKKIMVVDDEESLLQLVAAILGNEGYEVIQAANGKECLDKLKKETPDLILLDVMMPGMTGREVLENIRKNPKTKNIKVILLTVIRYAELGKLGKDMFKSLKVIDYITKPFENDDLIKRVKKVL